MVNAVISSPELALSEGVSLGNVGGNLDVLKDASDHFGVDGVIPDEAVMPVEMDSKLPDETYQQYYTRLANQIQNDLKESGEEIPGITDISPENLAKDLFLHDHPEVKAKMVEAAAMVNMYTNTVKLPNSEYPEINLHAMDTAAQEVLTQAMKATSVEQIQSIKPEEAAATAILVHYYNTPEPQESLIKEYAEDIGNKWESAVGKSLHINAAEYRLSRSDSFGPDFKLEDVSMAHSVSPANVGNKAPSVAKGAALA